MGKLRKNLENTNAFVQASHQEILALKSSLSRIEAKLETISSQVLHATFKTLMGDSSDLSEFFPVQRQEQLELFMDRNHPEWTSRRNEFYHFLFTIIPKTKRGFAKGMLTALFDRKYISSVKWPSSG